MSGSIIVSGASLKPDDSATDDSSTSSSTMGPDGPATVSFSYPKYLAIRTHDAMHSFDKEAILTAT